MVETTRLAGYRAGVPVYSYLLDPAVPPISVVRFHDETMRHVRRAAHQHDFPAVLFFERDGGTLRSGGRAWPIRAGDLFVVAPGDVMAPGQHGHLDAHGAGVFFTPEALGHDRPEPLLSWRAHPLLFPFVGGMSAGASGPGRGALRLRVPEDQRVALASGITALETELAQRRDGYRQASAAHLVLLLVTVARLANDVVGDLRRGDEKLLADVFTVIEQRYREPSLSLREVARAVNLTPGHLTTTLRRKTGRTVQAWIIERRLTEARRLLEETELPVGEVSGAVGFADPSYFARAFRRAHGLPPREWRVRGSR